MCREAETHQEGEGPIFYVEAAPLVADLACVDLLQVSLTFMSETLAGVQDLGLRRIQGSDQGPLDPLHEQARQSGQDKAMKRGVGRLWHRRSEIGRAHV